MRAHSLNDIHTRVFLGYFLTSLVLSSPFLDSLRHHSRHLTEVELGYPSTFQPNMELYSIRPKPYGVKVSNGRPTGVGYPTPRRGDPFRQGEMFLVKEGILTRRHSEIVDCKCFQPLTHVAKSFLINPFGYREIETSVCRSNPIPKSRHSCRCNVLRNT